MKFVHAADLHVDSPLRGLDGYEGAPVERLRTVYEAALEHPQVVGLAIGTRPDCLAEPVLELLSVRLEAAGLVRFGKFERSGSKARPTTRWAASLIA